MIPRTLAFSQVSHSLEGGGAFWGAEPPPPPFRWSSKGLKPGHQPGATNRFARIGVCRSGLSDEKLLQAAAQEAVLATGASAWTPTTKARGCEHLGGGTNLHIGHNRKGAPSLFQGTFFAGWAGFLVESVSGPTLFVRGQENPPSAKVVIVGRHTLVSQGGNGFPSHQPSLYSLVLHSCPEALKGPVKFHSCSWWSNTLSSKRHNFLLGSKHAPVV